MKKLNGIEIANKCALKMKGKCISNRYANIDAKMLWKCINKHQWFATLKQIKDRGHWCPHCANNAKLDGLKIARELADNYHGKCLSKKYINATTKMVWQCSEKHKWKATLNNIRNQRQWCSKCRVISNNKNIFNILCKIAKSKGGKCLSKKYVNSNMKMLWKCESNHKWKTTSSQIKNKNQWCPDCAQIQRYKSQNNYYVLSHWKTNEIVRCHGSWEKKVAEYLNTNKINYRWQPRSFRMSDGRRYYPDLYLFSTKQWVEIKGYFWGDAEEKWEWFQSIKPNSELWNRNKLKQMGIL